MQLAVPFLVEYILATICFWGCTLYFKGNTTRRIHWGFLQFTVLAVLFTLAQAVVLLIESELTRGLILISYAAVFAVISIRLLVSFVRQAKKAIKEDDENREYEESWFQQFDYQLITLGYLGLMLFLYIAVVIKAGIL